MLYKLRFEMNVRHKWDLNYALVEVAVYTLSIVEFSSCGSFLFIIRYWVSVTIMGTQEVNTYALQELTTWEGFIKMM